MVKFLLQLPKVLEFDRFTSDKSQHRFQSSYIISKIERCRLAHANLGDDYGWLSIPLIYKNPTFIFIQVEK